MVTPRVTVLLPVRNGMPFIADAVRSLLEQSRNDIAVFVLDDGSTDATGEYIEALGSEKIRLFRFERIGLPAVLNRGLECVETEFTARMDADDYSHAERIAMQVQHLDAHPECVLVGTGIRYISRDGRRSSWDVRVPEPHDEIVRGMIARESVLFHPTILCRTRALVECGGYDPDAYPAEDYDLYFRLSRKGVLANIGRPLLDMRVHSTSIIGGGLGKSFRFYDRAIQRHSGIAFSAPKKAYLWIDARSAAIYRKGLDCYLNGPPAAGIFLFLCAALVNPWRLFKFFKRRWTRRILL